MELFQHVISVPMKVRLKLVILAMAISSCELIIILQEILLLQVNWAKIVLSSEFSKLERI